MTSDYNDLTVQVGDNIIICHLHSKFIKSINSTFILLSCMTVLKKKITFVLYADNF